MTPPPLPPVPGRPGRPVPAAGWRGLLLSLLLLPSGCAVRPGPESDAAGEPDPAPGTATPPAETLRPRGASLGRVVSVQGSLRFAVVDFGLNPIPAPGTVLEVERDGGVVGRLRTGRDARGGMVAADVQDGEVTAGDRVRVP